MPKPWVRLLRALWRKEEVEQELREELRFHLEMETKENMASGMDPDEARRMALRNFGGVEQIKEECRDQWGVRFIETLWQDLRYGARILLKNPVFALASILTLSLGIGANSTLFSIVNTVLLRPLAYKEPDRLVSVGEINLKKGEQWILPSPADFLDWRERNRVFEQLAAWRVWLHNLSGSGEPEQLPGVRVSANFFRLLGIEVALGRTFLPEEEQVGRDQVVVITHGLWTRRFAADPNLIGKSLRIDNKSFTVVGILPPDFHFPRFFLGGTYELWMPLAFDRNQLNRGDHSVSVSGRLLPDLTLEQAQAHMETIARQLADEYPETNQNLGVAIRPWQAYSPEIRVALILLLSAVSFVLLIACANVVNLLLARASVRQREIAIRSALGAGRWRLVRQLLTESMLLAGLSGALGLLLARGGLHLFTTLGPANFPRLGEIEMDGHVLVFTMVLSLLSAFIFGLVPALEACKTDLNASLKEAGRGLILGLRRRRIQDLLVVCEVALAVVLLVGAGLMIKSLLSLHMIDRGVNVENVLTMQVWLPESRYSKGHDVAAFYQEALGRIEIIPEVRSASAISFLPLTGWGDATDFTIEGRPVLSEERLNGAYRVIDPDYFRTMNIPLLQGRYFTEEDINEASGVAIIDATAERLFWPNEEPIGKRIRLTVPESDAPWRAELNDSWLSIVGVVGAVKEEGIVERTWPYIYLPYAQNPSRLTSLVIRTMGDPMSLSPAVRRQVWMVDKDQPVSFVRSLQEVLSLSLWRPHFYVTLLGTFAAVAVVLAVVGIYGVTSYSVTLRTHEMGIRTALGAQPAEILTLVVTRALKLALIGVAIGLVGAVFLTRFMSSLLFGVSATDPVVFLGVSLLLLAVSLVASFVPARRSSKMNPMVALRYE